MYMGPTGCSKQAEIEKFKMKIYVSSGIRTNATPRSVKQRFWPLSNDFLMVVCELMSYRIVFDPITDLDLITEFDFLPNCKRFP